MTRKLARIAAVNDITPIAGADLIELARVGGWRAVVKKGEFQPGSLGIYFEIDTFLPSGNPAWQFLVDKAATTLGEQTGHVLRTMTLKKALSQGLLLPLGVFGPQIQQALESLPLGSDVTELMGVLKYEKPLSEDLARIARGYKPSLMPTTDQERVQNLTLELQGWIERSAASDGDAVLSWERTEKFEGESTSFGWVDGELHVCSRQVDFKELDEVPHWQLAKKLKIREKFKTLLSFGSVTRELVLQGEMVGPGVEGNVYGLAEREFYLYNVYDIRDGRYWNPAARRILAQDMGLKHVPVLDKALVLSRTDTADSLLAHADGPSALNPKTRREGDVYKCNEEDLSFKAISNEYLLKGAKMK